MRVTVQPGPLVAHNRIVDEASCGDGALCIAPPTFCSTGKLRTKSCHLTSPATPIVSKDTDVGRQRTAAPGRLPAAGKVTRLPHSELEGSGDHDDRADGDRYAARQRRLLHLDRRQRDAQRERLRKRSFSEALPSSVSNRYSLSI
jgi:hypothetical protein